ncbi:phthiocerol/phthiodiolone dimycocerosyl transferase family protein [Nocardia aurantiaca]|nr:short-chain dehydrogenase [Nocardia aurantiaca]
MSRLSCPPSDIDRPLSHSERWYWILDAISPLNVVAWVTVAGRVTPEQLSAAAAAAVAEHPLLRVGIAADTEGTNPRFVPLAEPALPIRTVAADPCDTTAATREVDAVELCAPIPASGTLARLVDVVKAAGTPHESHELILTMSHVICDGTSILTLLRRILEYATATAASPGSRPPGPAVDDRLPARTRGTARITASMLADQLIAAGARPVRMPAEVPVPPGDRRTRLLTREICGADLAAVTSACRERGVTVHGALTAALATAVAREMTPGRTVRVPVGSPIDFRSEMAVDDGELGSFVATVPTHPRVGADIDFWDTARTVIRNLNRRRRFHQHLTAIAGLRLLCPDSVDRSGRVVDLINTRGPWNVCLTNVGRHGFPDRMGEWRLSGAQFAAGISCIGHLVSAVNTSHGVLRWNSTYVEGLMSPARADRIVDDALAMLLTRARPHHEEHAHD